MVPDVLEKVSEKIVTKEDLSVKQKAEQFLIDKGHQDDENSCVRIVDFILEKMNEKSK